MGLGLGLNGFVVGLGFRSDVVLVYGFEVVQGWLWVV